MVSVDSIFDFCDDTINLVRLYEATTGERLDSATPFASTEEEHAANVQLVLDHIALPPGKEITAHRTSPRLDG